MKALFASVLVALAALPGVVAEAQSSWVAREGQISFVMPSGNIGCVYTPAGGTSWYQPADGGPELQCDRIDPTYIRLVLTRSGPAAKIADVGDQGCCSDENPFPYGRTVVLGPFTCSSGTSGLTCSRADGHGFRISRAVSDAY